MQCLIRIAVAIALSAYPSLTFAADLTGSVHDQGGRPRSDAEVILKGTDQTTGRIRRDTRTTDFGEFAFPTIPPGGYELSCGNKPIPIRIRPGINRRDCQ